MRFPRWAAAALLPALAPAFAGAAPTPTGLRDAIAAAVGSRLESVAAGEYTAQARSRAMQNASSLLPQLTATLSEVRTFRVSLAAEGKLKPGELEGAEH